MALFYPHSCVCSFWGRKKIRWSTAMQPEESSRRWWWTGGLGDGPPGISLARKWVGFDMETVQVGLTRLEEIQWKFCHFSGFPRAVVVSCFGASASLNSTHIDQGPVYPKLQDEFHRFPNASPCFACKTRSQDDFRVVNGHCSFPREIPTYTLRLGRLLGSFFAILMEESLVHTPHDEHNSPPGPLG